VAAAAAKAVEAAAEPKLAEHRPAAVSEHKAAHKSGLKKGNALVPHTISWVNCGSSTDPLVLKSLSMTPDPAVSGQSVSVVVDGTLKRGFKSATVNVSIEYEQVPLFNTTVDGCTLTPQLTCPQSAGAKHITYTAEVPALASGDYLAYLDIFDQNEARVACYGVSFSIAESALAPEEAQ